MDSVKMSGDTNVMRVLKRMLAPRIVCAITVVFTMLFSLLFVLHWEPVFHNEKISYALYAIDATAIGSVASISTNLHPSDFVKPFGFPHIDTWKRGRQMGYLIDLVLDKLRAKWGWGIGQYIYGAEVLLIALVSVVVSQVLFRQFGFQNLTSALPALMFFSPFIMLGQSVVFRSSKYLTLPILLLMGVLLGQKSIHNQRTSLLLSSTLIVVSPFIDESTFVMCGSFMILFLLYDKRWKAAAIQILLCLSVAAIYWMYVTVLLPKISTSLGFSLGLEKGHAWMSYAHDWKGIVKSLGFSSTAASLGIPFVPWWLSGLSAISICVCLALAWRRVRSCEVRFFLACGGAAAINEIVLYRGFMHNQTFASYYAAWGSIAFLGILLVAAHVLESKPNLIRLAALGMVCLMFLCQVYGFAKARDILLNQMGIGVSEVELYSQARAMNLEIQNRGAMVCLNYPRTWVSGAAIPQPLSGKLPLSEKAYYISSLVFAREIELGHVQLLRSEDSNTVGLSEAEIPAKGMR